MTIDTIKNVLMRILSINKNLSEASLHNLLVASGWDDSDIKEGINIFRAYKLSGGNSDAVSEYSLAKTIEPVIMENNLPIEKKDELKKIVVPTVDDVTIIKSAETKPAENFMKEINESKANIVSLLDTNKQTQEGEVMPVEEVKIITTETNPSTQAAPDISNVPLVKTPDSYVSHESHLDSGELDAYNKREGKPIFLVILDVILFLVTLGLLIYILLS